MAKKTSSLPQTEHDSAKPLVVLGKRSVRRDEVQALRDFGYAMALRGMRLITTKTPGAPEEIANGFTAAGGEPEYLKDGERPDAKIPVVIFTNSAMLAKDENHKTWTERGWLIINNPKETQDAGKFARIIAAQRGTPLPDRG